MLDKPEGLSSNQALQTVRRLLNAQKAGHTGSLDPFATGVLPLCFGEATKISGYLLEADKSYQATLELGRATSTGDREGQVVQECPLPIADGDQIRALLAGMTGPQQQVPPMYSALKHQGRPLYELARAGITVDRPAREIVIHDLELLNWTSPQLVFRVRCSKGTYVRTLAETIAGALDSCGHLSALRRIRAEPFGLDDAISLDQLEQRIDRGQTPLLTIPQALPDWPRIRLDQEGVMRFRHGNPVAVEMADETRLLVEGETGLLGLGQVRTGRLQPTRLFNLTSAR